jgi:hypothetical protein
MWMLMMMTEDRVLKYGEEYARNGNLYHTRAGPIFVKAFEMFIHIKPPFAFSAESERRDTIADRLSFPTRHD